MAIKENLVIGVQLSYSHDDMKTGGELTPSNFKSNDYGASVFMRRYAYLGRHFYIFGQGNLGGFFTTDNFNNYYQQGETNSDKGFVLSLGFYPGISYAINNRIQLESGFNNLFAINYSHTKTISNISPGITQNQFSINSSLSNFAGLTLGIRFLINPV